MSNLSAKVQRARERLSQGWWKYLEDEFDKEYMDSIREFLKKESKTGSKIYPNQNDIFRALSIVDYDSVQVVILGQDPYHGDGQATGLCFAVPESTPIPPSLVNIFQEIQNEFGEKPKSSNLENWAKQGVLLLNTVLTVRANSALSHRGIGWETFTDRVIDSLNQRKDSIVFLLWGKQAQDKSSMITNPSHLILKAPHPSPLSAYRGFFGCGHFVQANEFLKEKGKKPIQWY